MKSFKFYNNVAGWLAFAIATVSYLLTIEPTASLWDCGEFIATAVKLEVGHPPGAPLWMLIGRIAALFAGGDVTMQAYMMNATSAIAGGFTVLFLFWSITHFAKKLVNKINYNQNDSTAHYAYINYTAGETSIILACGFVGSLIYCFCDTAWFSAVEAEVYSMSSLFTAVVFWCILKWEAVADEKYSNRWIILISYLMGLSIGVHLLNLLVIPAIVAVYYFKKYTYSAKGLILAMLLSVVILGVVLYGIIPGSVSLASAFELMFVNGFGLPYNSGLAFFLIISTAAVVFLLYWSQKNNKTIINTIVLAFAVIMIGYGSFAMTVIRSCAETPINENKPSTVFNLLSYLNREQYGDRPLIYGAYYTGKVIDQEIQYTYASKKIEGKDRYVSVPKTNPEYIYDDESKGFFPRMYSSSDSHISAYKSWAGITGNDKPTFFENLKFFFTYQVGHMYFRYFMWNFSGRQNDTQSHGSYINGNWITGIPFIDDVRLGNSDLMPQRIKSDESRNAYYLLPLILGFIGLFFGISHDGKNCFTVFLFFLLTGIAIVVYLNQTPYQPRERDYAFAGSFYAFTIWCGLGVMGVAYGLRQLLKQKQIAVIVSCFCILIPVQMAAVNWRDHDRSGRYTARDFAIDYLESCAPNAILFTFGDNDTFPLWYAQEVEGIRTDVRIVNLSLLGTDWYIEQMTHKCYKSDPLPFLLNSDKYAQDKRNVTPVFDRSGMLLAKKYKEHKTESDSMYKPLYDEFIQLLANSSFQNNYPEDYKKITSGISNFDAITFISICNTLAEPKNAEQIFGKNTENITALKDKAMKLAEEINKFYTPLSDVILLAGSDDQNDMVQTQSNGLMNYFASKKVAIKVNTRNCLDNGTLDSSNISKAGQFIEWNISKNYLLKNDLAVADIIAANDWKRPIYFACSGNSDDYMGLEKFFRLEGFAFRLMPYQTRSGQEEEYGEINGDLMYNNMMNKFKWGRMEQEDVYIDANVRRQIDIMDIRNTFARLAMQLVTESRIASQNNDQLKAKYKLSKAKDVIYKCLEILPDKKVHFDHTMIPLIVALYEAGDNEKAQEISRIIINSYNEDAVWYQKLKTESGVDEDRNLGIAIYAIGEFEQIGKQYHDSEIENLAHKYYKALTGAK